MGKGVNALAEREEAQVFDADISVGVTVSFGPFAILTGELVGLGLCHALGAAAAGTSAVLGQGSAVWVHYGAGGHRARLVGGQIENDEYMAGSPDFDVFVEQASWNNGDLEGFRFPVTIDVRARGEVFPGGDGYTFAELTPAEVFELQAVADQVCSLELGPRGLLRALGVIDGGVAALEQLVEGADIARWALARCNFLCDGSVISPLKRVDSVVEGGATSLVNYAGGRRREDDAMCYRSAFHEHAILHRAAVLRVTMGGLNLKNRVGVIPFLRRISQHEEAEAENPEAPSYDGSDRYLGICEGSGESQAGPLPQAHAAMEFSREAASMKEKRKATEARAAGHAIATAKADPAASATK